MPGASVAALDLAVTPEAWRALGFAVDADGTCRVGATELRLGVAGDGVTGWALRDAAGDGPVDGIATRRVGGAPAAGDAHDNTAIAVDHVVVATPDIERTFAALTGTGMALRRERTAGTMRQGFFRHGECIVEVVGPQAPDGDGPATLWGVTVVVGDIDAAAQLLGERLGRIKEAVQPGRRIATVRAHASGGVPLALITAARPG